MAHCTSISQQISVGNVGNLKSQMICRKLILEHPVRICEFVNNDDTVTSLADDKYSCIAAFKSSHMEQQAVVHFFVG